MAQAALSKTDTMLRPLLAVLFGLSLNIVTTAGVGVQTYRTEKFTPPDLTITKNGATEPGYLFFGPTGHQATAPAPLIMTDTNELIWQGPDGLSLIHI